MLELENIESEEYARRLKILDGLKSALRTQSLSFVERFIELNGLSHLLDFLQSMNADIKESRIHTSVIRHLALFITVLGFFPLCDYIHKFLKLQFKPSISS